MQNFGADPTLRLNGNNLLHCLVEEKLPANDIIEHVLSLRE